MQLPLQTFDTLIQNMAAAVQSAAMQLLDLTIGSTLRAVLEANASIALWMQWLVLQVLRMTRAATSGGADLDSWMADFSLARLPAVPATGICTVSRITPTVAAFIPLGTLVRTADGTQTFFVTEDATNAAWVPGGSGYVIPSGVSGLDIPVIAQVPGQAGNVQGGAVSLLASAVPGIDRVNNGSPYQNGVDAEADSAFRQRFGNFIASRSRATRLAVGYAITGIQQGLNFTLQENIDPSGQQRMGSFVVTVDDGSGYPSATLLSTIRIAIEAVRPVGSVFSVQPPTVMRANVSLTITVASGFVIAQVVSIVGTAIITYINDLAIGAALPLTKLAQIAYDASTGVINVGQLSLNGTADDLIPTAACVIKAGTVAVD